MVAAVAQRHGCRSATLTARPCAPKFCSRQCGADGSRVQDGTTGVQTGVDAGHDDFRRFAERAETPGERAESRWPDNCPARRIASRKLNPPHLDVRVGVKPPDRGSTAARVLAGCDDHHLVSRGNHMLRQDVQPLRVDTVVVRHQNPHGSNLARQRRAVNMTRMNTMRTMTAGSQLEVRTRPGAFGAVEIRGWRPALTEDASEQRALRAALWEQAVVCVRLSQPLTVDEARSLALMIGPIKIRSARRATAGCSATARNGRSSTPGSCSPTSYARSSVTLNFGGDTLRPGLFETFHTDDTYTESPAIATVLHARELPAGPGRRHHVHRHARRVPTCSMRRRRRQLLGLRTVHAYNNNGAFPPRVPAQGRVRATRRRCAPRRSSASGDRTLRALLRSRSRHSHRGHARTRRSCAPAIASGPRRTAGASLRARLATPRRVDLGQRGRSAPSRRRLPARPAPQLLALHDRGAGAECRRSTVNRADSGPRAPSLLTIVQAAPTLVLSAFQT